MATATSDGAAAARTSVAKVPTDVQPEIARLVQTFSSYKAAGDWAAIDGATRPLDEDCVYDSPFMYISGGRDRVRAVAKLLAPLAYTEFEPKLVRVCMDNTGREAEVEVDGTLRVVPRKYWWAPVTWFLPSSVPVDGTVTVRVKSWNDKVSLLKERFANIPTPPVLLRWLAGWGAGTTGVIMEPLIYKLYEWFSAGYSSVQGGVDQVSRYPAVAKAVDAADGMRENLAATADSVKAKAAGLVGAQ
ncbi:hypothetical protein CHLRE_12g514350v5 [Chlamydomonas reinhardtii]|uniref:Uncharacterized protein n=1 Tax=Chlamydomonas reinhardtii TaxID=3055 RepID=A8JHB9_CHLRE|nr:uncharacterized protein CHLRE_12g514350v5 [Chlamydomonas reinhardtii]PNW75139.1 hypothetical protein CHLRE_12g514350v5 [Chlamydomonas reinhardtii]|eukprot:XP_001703006.1 predicted protein [Chlamydomonas reinhardtii]